MKTLVDKIKNKIFKYLKEFETLSAREWVYRVLCVIAIMYAFIGLIHNIFFYSSNELDFAIAAATIIISFYLCYVYRYNIGLFIVMVFIAYSNYSISMTYFDPSIRNKVLYGQFGDKILSEALLCIFIFEVCLLLFSGNLVREPKLLDSKQAVFVKHKRNDLIGYGAMLVYALIFFLTFNFGENGSRGGGSALTEYRAVVFIIGSYYSAKKLNTKVLWSVLIGVTSVLAFLSGSRIDAICTLVALIVIWYSDFVTYKKTLVLLPFFMVSMMVVGVVRGGSITGDSLLSVLKSLWLTKLTWDTPIFAYVPSLAIVELAPSVEFLDKLKMFGGNLLYIVAGSAIGTSSNLIHYSREFYLHYYGCITPVYFYFWFGYAGSIFVALLVKMYSGFYQKMVKRESLSSFGQELKYILSVYFLSNVARWYCYGPNGLLRNMFVCGVAFGIVWGVDLLSQKIWMKRKV